MVIPYKGKATSFPFWTCYTNHHHSIRQLGQDTALPTQTERSQTPLFSHCKAASPQPAFCYCWTRVKYPVMSTLLPRLHGQSVDSALSWHKAHEKCYWQNHEYEISTTEVGTFRNQRCLEKIQFNSNNFSFPSLSHAHRREGHMEH